MATDHPPAGQIGAEALAGFLAALAAHSPTPAGGSAAASAAALGAALCEMAASFSQRELVESDRIVARARAARHELLSLVDEDAAAFDALLSSRRAARSGGAGDDPAEAETRVSEVPLRVAREARVVAADALRVLRGGRPALRGDAFAAVVLAGAGGAIAANLVCLNLAGSPEDARFVEARALAETLDSISAQAAAAVAP